MDYGLIVMRERSGHWEQWPAQPPVETLFKSMAGSRMVVFADKGIVWYCYSRRFGASQIGLSVGFKDAFASSPWQVFRILKRVVAITLPEESLLLSCSDEGVLSFTDTPDDDTINEVRRILDSEFADSSLQLMPRQIPDGAGEYPTVSIEQGASAGSIYRTVLNSGHAAVVDAVSSFDTDGPYRAIRSLRGRLAIDNHKAGKMRRTGIALGVIALVALVGIIVSIIFFSLRDKESELGRARQTISERNHTIHNLNDKVADLSESLRMAEAAIARLDGCIIEETARNADLSDKLKKSKEDYLSQANRLGVYPFQITSIRRDGAYLKVRYNAPATRSGVSVKLYPYGRNGKLWRNPAEYRVNFVGGSNHELVFRVDGVSGVHSLVFYSGNAVMGRVVTQ